MSQTLNLFDLNKALGFLRPAISNKNIPGLDHLYFHEGKISAFNGNTAVVVDFPLETDLKLGVPHSTFIKTISSLSSQPEFDVSEEGFLKVKAGRFKAVFPTTNITKETLMFHPPKDVSILTELPVTSNFISGLGRVWLGSRDAKIEESGVNIFSSEGSPELDIITYDGLSSSRYNLTLDKTIPSLILPYNFCDAIMKTVDIMLLPPSKLWLSENFAVAEFTEQIRIYSSYFAGPANTGLYSASLKLFNSETEYSPIPEGFADSLKRFASVVDQSSLITMDCSGNHLILNASGPTGMLEEELDIEQTIEGHWSFPLSKLISIQPYVNKMKLMDRCIIFKGIDEHFAHAVAIRN